MLRQAPIGCNFTSDSRNFLRDEFSSPVKIPVGKDLFFADNLYFARDIVSFDKIIKEYEKNENFSYVHHYREDFYFIKKENVRLFMKNMVTQENIKISIFLYYYR